MMPAFFYFQHTLNRRERWGGEGVKLTPPVPPEKTTLKNPNLIRVKDLFLHFCIEKREVGLRFRLWYLWHLFGISFMGKV